MYTSVPIQAITNQVDFAILTQDLTNNTPLEAHYETIHGNYIMWTFNINGQNVTLPVEVLVKLQVYSLEL